MNLKVKEDIKSKVNVGKNIRIERIISRKTNRTIIIPMDHGLTLGTIKGLENLAEMVNKVALGGANAVLMHSGMIGAGHRRYGKDIGLILDVDRAATCNDLPKRR